MAKQKGIFVDKSLLLTELIPSFGSVNCYCCITRPRRFGKTVMANMIGAFFGKTDKSDCIFQHLAVSEHNASRTHRNRYDVIYIDFSRAPKGCSSYAQYIRRIENSLVRDLLNACTDCGVSADDSPWDALQKIYEEKEHKFLFVLDEWDAAFHMPFVSAENQKEYLLFLKCLLKDQPYVEFAYMAASEKFSEYFGLSDTEVDNLYEIYKKNTEFPKFTRQELRIWYDGYYTAAGTRLYNPRSVVLALTDNQLRNYWIRSGPYDELFYYIRHNVEDVKDDLVLMISGERVSAGIGQFAASSMEIHSREHIYSAMVVYGLLTYENGKMRIVSLLN